MKHFYQEKLNSLIHHEIADILLKNFAPPPSTIVTVSRTSLNADDTVVDVFLNVFPEKNKSATQQELHHRVYHLQQILNKRLALKTVPKIVFKIESYNENVDKVFEILK